MIAFCKKGDIMGVSKIAILTSGGDCQAMNATINIITRVATFRKLKVVGVLQGYRGLYENKFVPLTLDEVENISSVGGTILKTSRFPELANEQVLAKCVQNLKANHIDVLIVIGGDGSYHGAKALRDMGVNIIAIPATIDNDLRYTDKCLGFDTAVNNVCGYIENVKQTMQAMDRGVVFEVMGRYCGDIALYSASATACDILAVPEKPISEQELLEKVKHHLAVKHTPPTIVISEKLFDIVALADKLTNETGMPFRYSIVGYAQRGGSPSVEDKTLAMQFGVRAVELAEKGLFNRAIGIRGKDVFETTIDKALSAEYSFNYELLNLFYLLNSNK
jgi:6-phosphofructokinase 1